MPKIEVTTIYGVNTQTPIVEIRFPKPAKGAPPHRERLIQMTVPEARNLAVNILQAAEAAIQDAFLVEFFKELGIDDAEVSALLSQYRLRRRDRQTDSTA